MTSISGGKINWKKYPPGRYNRYGRMMGGHRKRKVNGQWVKGRKPSYARRGGRYIGSHRSRLNTRTGGFLGIEHKFYDTSLAAAALTANTDTAGGEHNPSATITLNTVVQGDGQSQRDGRKIVMKKIMIRGIIDIAGAIDQTVMPREAMIFIALVLDTQANGALIVSETVFENKGATALLNASLFNAMERSSRYKILKRLSFSMPSQQVAHDGTNIEISAKTRPWQMMVNLKDLNVLYSGTTETIVNIVDNSLNLIAWCTNTDTVPRISYNARLRFVG